MLPVILRGAKRSLRIHRQRSQIEIDGEGNPEDSATAALLPRRMMLLCVVRNSSYIKTLGDFQIA